MSASPKSQKKVAIIGAGLSGLACAMELSKQGLSPTVFEKSDRIGGRIKTDNKEGFLLDHGFQVYLPSYEQGKYFLDHQSLGLKPFSAGAKIFANGRYHSMSDPLREPQHLLSTALSSLATIKDKFLTLKLILNSNIEYTSIESRQTAMDFLSKFGFSQKYINSFFVPFFSGIFLNRNLEVSADYFRYLFHKFSKAYASLPEKGMQSIPEQMAKKIGSANIKLKTDVETADLLSGGFDHVFVAHADSDQPHTAWHSVRTEYYKTQSTDWVSKTLYLNSSPNSYVNHVACLSAAQPSYAPAGWHLFSVNILNPENQQTKKDLAVMFSKKEVDQWQYLTHYDIKKALPAHPRYGKQASKKSDRISYCGDHLESASIQGALYSGLKAAEKYLNCI